MPDVIRWQASAELAALLQRYYRGDASLWGEIQARVHGELQTRGLQLAARHLRFRPNAIGYVVILEEAEEFLQ